MMTAPEWQLSIKLGKGTAGEDGVNSQHSPARTSNENSLLLLGAYPCTRASAHAPAQGETYSNLLKIKIFSTNVGQHFQK